LTTKEAEKIWDVVGGSMWEIQILLSQLFKHPIDEVLALYKKKIMGMVAYYIGANNKKEKALKIFLNKEKATIRDFIDAGIDVEEVEELLPDMVRNNILYFDPTEAIYYPQGKSYRWGIRLYFEGLA
jgi:hypothetical protein